MRSPVALLRGSVAARVAGVAVLVALIVLAGVGVRLLVSDEPAASPARTDVPPPLSREMIEVLESQGLSVVPDEVATRDRAKDVRTIVDRFGKATDSNPEREVAGVSLARVTDRDDDRLHDSLRWVVFVEGALSHCFGGDMCTGERVLGTEVMLLDADSLDYLTAYAF